VTVVTETGGLATFAVGTGVTTAKAESNITSTTITLKAMLHVRVSVLPTPLNSIDIFQTIQPYDLAFKNNIRDLYYPLISIH
jgi:hypothetical protein